MKNVLQIVYKMDRAGAETFIMNVYRNINREKYRFIFLCNTKEKGDYDDEIKQLGGKIVYFTINKNIFKLAKDFKNLLKEEQIDIIHSHIGFFSGVYCLIGKLNNVRVRITHCHTSNSLGKNNFLKKVYKKVMKSLIYSYSTNRLACGDLAGKYLYNKNYEVIPNGIELTKFKTSENDIYKKQFNINNELVIGHIGRFAKVKNHEFFIPLAQELKNENIKFKIILVGEGELKQQIEEEVNERGLQDYFIFTGVRNDVEKIMHVFDVLVMPSKYEGFPVTIIEALAAGLPCVISDTISSEVNIIPKACEFVSLNESNEYWVKKIVESSKLHFNCEENWKILDSKGFSISSVVKKLERIYDKGE